MNFTYQNPQANRGFGQAANEVVGILKNATARQSVSNGDTRLVRVLEIESDAVLTPKGTPRPGYIPFLGNYKGHRDGVYDWITFFYLKIYRLNVRIFTQKEHEPEGLLDHSSLVALHEHSSSVARGIM